MTSLEIAPCAARSLPFGDLGRHAERPVLVTPAGALRYAELDRQVTALADALGPTRRLVAVEAANTVPAVVAYLGALRGGHAVLLLPPGAGAAGGLGDAYDPDVVLGSATGWEPRPRRPGTAHRLHDDLALLLSTSGSTGSPKLVRLSADNLASNAAAIAEYLRLSPDDRAITTLPMQYCYGLSVINSHLHVGGAVVLTERSVVDPCFWELFRSTGATGFAGVPHTFDLLDRIGFADMAVPSLRRITQAGGRLQPDTVRRYAELGEARGWELVVMYGQTEATARMAYLPPELARRHPASIGVPIPGGSLHLDEPDADGVGELVYRGPNVMLGYAHGPDDLALGRTVRELRTGDLARRTDDGLFEVAGRRSRFVKPFGLRVDLDRVEALLAEAGTPGLCAGDDRRIVVAVDDPAHVAVAEATVAERTGVPRGLLAVRCVDELPRLLTGKPDHAAVLALAAPVAADPAPTPAPGGTASATTVHDIYAEVLGRQPADGNTFVDLGGDSLTYVELSIRLEQHLGALPRDWHLRPIGHLARAPRRRSALAATDTTVVLRALAIALVVVTHVGLWHLPGGAHALVTVAGYNFARFQLRAGSIVAATARIAVPSMCWIGIVAATGERFGWPNALLVHGFVERPGDRWGYWFVEALVLILLALAALAAIPAVARIERRWPFATPVLLASAGLLVRFDVIELTSTHRFLRPHEVFWLFALGWAAARASGAAHRVLVSVIAVVGIAGFFGDPGRELLVQAAVLLVVWAPTVAIPRRVQRAIAPVAAASLYIYLTHWQVYPPVERNVGQIAAVVVSVCTGVVAWRAVQPAASAVERTLRSGRARVRAARRSPAAPSPATHPPHRPALG
jgi:acyl-CoA synthetase (AMP-forming)/AMP-acid ligase II